MSQYYEKLREKKSGYLKLLKCDEIMTHLNGSKWQNWLSFNKRKRRKLRTHD